MRLPISSLAALLAFGLGSEIVHATEKGEEGEGAAISERARLELKARGGAPRLSTAASEYGARRAEHARGLRTLALPDAAWVPIGPSSAPGRMTSLAPHPSVSGTLYAGAADGGLFRTTDGGATWTPLTDDVPNLSVGAVALAPSAPATIYLGTGEGGPPASFVPGIGLLKSTDGGATWTLPSAVVARQFFRISVHPSSPNVLVAATGSGGLLSTDGGATFATVIAASQYGVVADLARDASRPETLYAATWCPSGVACARGPARVLKSTDGGVTWAEKGSGLSFTGDADEARVSIAIGRSAPNVLYAARAEGGVAHLYRSDDGAESWSEVAGVGTSGDATVRGYMGGQSWYDNVLAVSPTNADLVFAGGLYTIRSTDGGRGFAHPAFAGAHVHLDVHDLAFQGSTLWVATDGGVFSTSDSGDTARDANASLVTRQYYSVAQHSARPDRLLAGAQDNGTDQRAATAWRSARGGDGFDCAYDALVPDVAWATAEYGRVFRSDASGALDAAFSEVTPRWADLGEAPPFRTVLVADPSRSGRILTGASRIVESTDGGTTWRPLGTAMSDGGTFGSDAVGAIAISKDALLVAKGASVLRSTDGGASYRNASGGLPGANVNGLEIDPRDSRIAWAALAATTGESIWGTTDGGASWLARSGGLPPFAAHVVKADPADASAVYAGTDVGVFRSTDAGTTWARFGSGLPAVSVRSLAISGDGTLVRAATHGRGLYELRTASSAGNAPPVVSILRPSAGASVAGGAPVAFEGTVSDPDGDAVTAFWTFGDTWETVALAGAASHSFREKGVYPVTLTARDAKGALSVASLLVTVTTSALENPDPPRWLVAGMAYADGAGGTFWQSDFSVFNPDPSRSMTLSLAFLDGRSAGSAAPRFVAVTIGPQRTRSFPNVLASAPFSLPKGSFGALLVRGDVLPAQPVLNGRTYNAGSGSAGTFGLSVPAVPIPSGLTAQAAGGPPPTLIGLREAPGIAHTNLVLANLGSDPASVQISFVDAKGAALGTPLRIDLAAYAVRQLNRVLAAAPPEGAGVASPAPSYAALVTTLSGKVFPYATVIDDRTSDPIVISPAARTGASARLPGIVRTRGRNNTLFESDVVVQNPMSRTRTISLRYTFQSFMPSLPPSAVQTVAKTVTLGPKETLEIDDFVASWLGLSDPGTTTAYASSYLDVTADDGDPVLVLGQTYNAPAGGGRVGFQIPGYTSLDGASAAGANRRLVMAGLTSNASYRTNVAFFLASGDGGSAARGTVKVVDGNGRILTTRAISLSASAPFVQLNDADLLAGAGSSLTVLLDGVDGNAPIAAYATVIDNTSGDAVLAPGQPSP